MKCDICKLDAQPNDVLCVACREAITRIGNIWRMMNPKPQPKSTANDELAQAFAQMAGKGRRL
jgi:hypothetical protein